MDFLAHLDSPQGLSHGDMYKPSLFELIAQEKMRELLEPALKYILTISAQRYPRWLLGAHRYHKWLYAFIMAIVEYQRLCEWGGSFTENFYGLYRVGIRDSKSRSSDNALPLNPSQIRKSLVALIIIPLIKSTLDETHEKLTRSRTSVKLNILVFDDANIHMTTSEINQTYILDKMKHAVVETFKVGYPYLSSAYTLSLIGFQIAYMYGKTPHYDPWLWLSGLKLQRLSALDYQSHDKRVGAIRDVTLQAISSSVGLRHVALASQFVAQELLGLLQYALPMGVFFFNFLEWWYSTDHHKTTNMLPIPPPPDSIKPHPKGLKLPDNTHTCPICVKPRTNPAMLPTGYVFCYPCVFNYVAEFGRCPITHVAYHPIMVSPEVYEFLAGVSITCHSFNADRTQVAVSSNDNIVNIYHKSATGWTLAHVLSDHDKLVTCIDWAPTTNRIVTCSQDRNAYVWTWEPAVQLWKPTLVLLRINRAATFVRWSPLENKFAVASGARLISICYFEGENNWWVSKHIKKPIRSTVLSVDWHPENILIVAGSADMKARVFSAWIKGIDAKASNAVWGEKLPFGTICGEFAAGGWVHGVAFSPSGNAIGYVSHDSTISIANGPTAPLQVVTTSNLPFVSLFFASEHTIVAAGHDCAPYLVVNKGNSWELSEKIDSGRKKSVTGNSAFNKFRQMDSRAQAITEAELMTTHQNTITSVRPYAGSGNGISKFTSSGVDGRLVVWDLLSAGIAGLRL
ncbi:hypothetical protein BSLG_008765 [Batrachochytrium salamandrivorans]|nr:hypothetical protein BSLG_008765 [Batrachochytrium salamandrivorans]